MSNTPRFISGKEVTCPLISGLVKPYLQSPPRHLISNVNVKVRVVRLGQKELPVVIAGDHDENLSYVTSPYVNYISYALEALQSSIPKSRLSRFLFERLSSCLKLLLSKRFMDKVVIVNSWLLATGPKLDLTESEIFSLSGFIEAQYPSHVILFRGVYSEQLVDKRKILEKSGYRLFFNRLVNVFDPSEPKAGKKYSHYRRDRNLKNRNREKILTMENFDEKSIDQLEKLYRSLYLEKYSGYSSALTKVWFKELIASKAMNNIVVEGDGVIDCFIGYYQTQNEIVWAVVGHDEVSSKKNGSYRMALSQLFEISEELQIPVNLSSGVSSFKTARGCTQASEYDIFYLPSGSRISQVKWSVVFYIYEILANRLYKKYGF